MTLMAATTLSYLLPLLGCHCPPARQVRLVADQHDDHALIGVLAGFLEPSRQVAKRLATRHTHTHKSAWHDRATASLLHTPSLCAHARPPAHEPRPNANTHTHTHTHTRRCVCERERGGGGWGTYRVISYTNNAPAAPR